MSEFLSNVQQSKYRTTEGPVKLPILYHETTQLQAFFSVEAARVEKLLANTGLQPAVVGGRAFAGLVFFEYRKTSIGPYNEAGLAVACYPAAVRPSLATEFAAKAAARHLGFHVLHLPVTTPLACAAGRELWGFPKFVTRIPFERTGRQISAAVLDPGTGRPIVALRGDLLPGIPLPAFDMVLYSQLKALRLKTAIETKGRMKTALGGFCTLEVGPSRHPMADTLRELGLDGARPALLQYSEQMQSILPAGEVYATVVPAKRAASAKAPKKRAPKPKRVRV